jgi:hypothetical protein
MLAMHHLRAVWAHQQLQDHPKPHPDVDEDVGVGPTQDSNDLLVMLGHLISEFVIFELYLLYELMHGTIL